MKKAAMTERIVAVGRFLEAQLRDIQERVNDAALILAQRRPENFAFWEQTESAKQIWTHARDVVQDALTLLQSGKTEPQWNEWRKALLRGEPDAAAQLRRN